MKKKLEDYTHKELLNLSNEELSELFDSEREKKEENNKTFFNNKYHSLSLDEKIKYWSGQLGRQMRWDVEEGIDPYSMFSLDWYKEVKRIEPEVDLIIDTIFSKYWSTTGVDWDKNIYNFRIKTDYRPHRIEWSEFVESFKDYSNEFFKDFVLKAKSKGIVITKENSYYYLYDEKGLKDLLKMSSLNHK